MTTDTDVAVAEPTTIAPPSPPLVIIPQSETLALIEAIIAAAHDPDVDIVKMERLMAMHERIAMRHAEQAFNDAMNKAQASMGRIAANQPNTQTKSLYATYAQIDKHLRPIYSENGFSLSFDTGHDAPEQHVRVLCYVSHTVGHTRTYHADIPADGKGAKGGDVMTKTHATGSAMSYGMRYLLKLIFNVAIGEDDDDGNGAGDYYREATEADLAYDELYDRLMKTTTDKAAAALWTEGSKMLSEFKRTDLYDLFKEFVVLHRTNLKGASG